MFVFGKSYSELTPEEKKEYNRLMKRRSRNLDPYNNEKARRYYHDNKEVLLKKREEWKKNNPEKAEAYRIAHSRKKAEPFKNALSRQMFGCAVTEMTPEQRKLYNTTRCLRYQKSQRQKKLEKTENSLD